MSMSKMVEYIIVADIFVRSKSGFEEVVALVVDEAGHFIQGYVRILTAQQAEIGRHHFEDILLGHSGALRSLEDVLQLLGLFRSVGAAGHDAQLFRREFSLEESV